MTVTLRCMTWNHSRAFPPLIATAQRYEELHPGVNIRWEKRTLHEFGHASVPELAKSFDLIVVDHPMLGEVEESNALVDLKPLLAIEEWNDLSADSVGPSFESYVWNGKLYALPIDAAAPAASYRSDLLTKAGADVPSNWKEVVSLAQRGLVRMPGFSADLFLNFMGMCVSSGSEVASNSETLFDRAIARTCMEQLRQLAQHMPKQIYSMNPLAIYEAMSSADEFAYCPFAYTYNNYSREGFGRKRIRYADPVSLEGNAAMRTVLGGTGIALSAQSNQAELALDYARFVASRSCQRTLYSLAGGQGARRSAWQEPLLNQITDNFFQRTEPSIERAYVRPRYRGYVPLQERGGLPIAACLRGEKDIETALDELDGMYRETLGSGSNV